jgi:hypothetical protein
MAGTYAWGKGVGDRFGGSETSDLKSLTDALAAYKNGVASGDQFSDKNKSEDNSPMGPLTPMDRIKAAFDSLKDMHKGPDQTPQNTAMLAGPNSPSPFDNAQWPQGPQGAPSQAQASVPMPQARPPGAPLSEGEANGIYDSFENSPAGQRMRASTNAMDAQQNPMMSLFQRSAAMQRDPQTGEFIDPASAAKAQPGIFHGLFG